MANFSADTLEQIKSKLSIAQVVGEYVALTKRTGKNQWGLCPFHTEKTPSFSIDETTNRYMCFGCHESGSIFDFVMKMESLDFREAVVKLAEKANVELNYSSSETTKVSEKKILYEMYDRIAKSFAYILENSDNAKKAREYLVKRKINDETRKEFLLGYAPSDPKWLYRFLKQKGYSDEILEKSGLFSSRHKDYPLFVDRLIFPIRDLQSRVVAFSGRAMNENNKAKYINSSESIIYSKRNMLFGAYESIKNLRRTQGYEKNVIICEGNFDVIALRQASYDIAVAPLGTAFTLEQAKIIKNYNPDKVILLFDNDSAGINATKKALALLASLDIFAYVLKLEDAKDPNEYLIKFGEKSLHDKLSTIIKGDVHLVNICHKLYDKEGSYGKNKMITFLFPFLENVTGSANGDIIIRDISQSLNIDERTFRATMKKLKNASSVTNTEKSEVKKLEFESSVISTLLVRVFQYRHFFPLIEDEIEYTDLSSETELELYNVLKDAQQSGVLDSDDLVLSLFKDESIKEYVASKISQSEDLSEDDLDKEIRQKLLIIKRKKLKALRTQLASYLEINSDDKKAENDILLQLLEVDKEIQRIKNKG